MTFRADYLQRQFAEIKKIIPFLNVTLQSLQYALKVITSKNVKAYLLINKGRSFAKQFRGVF